MERYDPSQLTEFPRFEGEASQSGVSTFFNKLWKFPLFSPSESSDNLENKVSVEDAKPTEEEKENYDLKTEVSYTGELEGRSLPNVLKRIKSLVALGSGGGTKYADTELARYWMPDDISKECYECAARFGTLRRRHHCRVCGQIFCSRCCSQRVPGQIFGCAGGLRVCTYCCNVVLSYLRENDMTGEITPDLRTLQENLQTKFPDNKAEAQKEEFLFAREQELSDKKSFAKDLVDIYQQLTYSLPIQQHRYRLVKYNGVWRGGDILQWVMDNTSYKSKSAAENVCQRLLGAGQLERMTEPPQFAEYALYRPRASPPPQPASETRTASEESGIVSSGRSVSSYCLDLNLGTSCARLTKATKRVDSSSELKTPQSCDDQPVLEQSYETGRALCRGIEQSGAEHLALLMRQWAARAGLAPAWLPVLYPLCARAAHLVDIDMMSGDMDVRKFVQIKKVPGGEMSDSRVIHGVVITKNVTHRGMPKQISNPTILLLDCSIAYQRVEGKLTSLEPLLMQEQEYLMRCAARISALRPRVVLVRGSVAGAVQECLLASGVALAVRVGGDALARVGRCVRADTVSSVDARIAAPRLGSAENFYVTTYPSKTLMVFEGCAEPNLGCCILLRGGSLQELAKVKRLVRFMVLACYNWKLEKAFLADIEAKLPEPDTFVADDAENVIDAPRPEDTSSNISNLDDCGDDIFDRAKDEDEDKLSENKSIKSIDTSSVNGEERDSDNVFESKNERDGNKVKARKTESDKNLSCGVPIRDFSDPLRSTMSLDDEVFLPKQEAKLQADTQSERWCTDDVVLSMSPNIVVPAPTRPLRRPPPPAPHTPRPHRAPPEPQRASKTHEFITKPITTSADDPEFKAALASFRANGGRVLNGHKPECPKYTASIVKPVDNEEEKKQTVSEIPDPLSPENHQQLSLLIYSYCSKSPNVPDFCVNPWIVTMVMYGKHDISLGAFLEKYCFNGDHRCPSHTCHVPMNQHVRRFVHEDVCVTITCNTVGHSNVDDDKLDEQQARQVRFWSMCEVCKSSGPAVTVSRRALALSLCGYVRARLAAPRYRRHCPHPLNTHTHAFRSGLTTARFRYEKITTYDIVLPPDEIRTNYDTKQMRDALIAHLNELMLKGHEAFTGVCEADGEREREYAAFRQHADTIHLALTAPPAPRSPAAAIRNLWAVYDSIITGEKMLRDALEKWSSPNAKTKADTSAEEKDLEDCSEVVSSDSSELLKDSDAHLGDEDEEKGENKKTVKQILSQLLSNNHSSNQASIIISSGLVPVVVRVGDVGSVIAATLASLTYHKSLAQLRQSCSAQTESEEGDTNTGKDKTDGDKTKAKTNDHIEVQLKEGLICRVYYAAQFRRLRHMLVAPLAALDTEPAICCDETKDDGKSLCDIEEGFVRSLAHCVPWAARGGKSGSTFCKTQDDRFVLKEMTKPEWQQFLEFAPHYFQYVINCRQRRQPSLLARIVGVFSVGGSSSGVLVLEHVWYGRAPALRFDLKGTSRPRALPTAGPAPADTGVMLDENLLKLRWERQLYVSWAAAGALRRAVERDTAFLLQHHVMDYSLLLGIEDRRLVVGIIDYIRTFTWDKKLEHLVKKNLGSGQPTVVSPEQYRERFCAALRKYFLQCPHHWDHLYEQT
ncbi:1-phosphatidylinositol 3-phosphate 5-kinase [Aricia agestis]|uniref:1-phosphatidylinositol 3-phosphate 5-kinase n=1 Tax=Aricia agestis TaxID=91739 RepID=UPI001C20521B|nr:1-phosphatidylinositol 3-phosphate 5-kinase [Aricia agestis]